jgi:hypothetical protein
MLEELKEAYGKDYAIQLINIGEGEQKDKWFTELGPNGRIPVLVDHDNEGVALMEGQAILQYLARRYDPGKLWPARLCRREYTDVSPVYQSSNSHSVKRRSSCFANNGSGLLSPILVQSPRRASSKNYFSLSEYLR